MATAARRTKNGATNRRDEDARARIFTAAVQEFAAHGLAGARTEAIAKGAGVNIALLFYYFRNKEQLYQAVLEETFAGYEAAVLPALTAKASPSERILRYAAAFYDYVAQSARRACLVHQEMSRPGKGKATVHKYLKQYKRPMDRRLRAVLREGIAAGEFRSVDIENFVISVSPLITHYFSASAAIQELIGADPLTPTRIAARKAAVLDLIGAALLVRPRSYVKGRK